MLADNRLPDGRTTGINDRVSDFVHDLAFQDLPPDVAALGRRCLLDLIGVAAAGAATPVSAIIRDHAARHFGPGTDGPGARLLLDGRRVSPAGAALAGGMTIDSFDAHDGHALTKGHAGAAVLPAVLALADAVAPTDGAELLTRLVLGYEVATRAGIALHATAPDYHTSGAWNALACAALGARALRLDGTATAHALGTAEYHGPRSQMMRCIDHPTMVKDGSGWGAMAGVSAAFLAADGFTGAPALTVTAAEVAHLWADLGVRWRIREQYFKPYPVCRWAQPAMEAAAQLLRDHDVTAGAIEGVVVESFDHAVRLATRHPATTEEAQYSLVFPLAALLVHGRLGEAEIAGAGLSDAAVLRLAARTELAEDAALTARFPAERWARVRLRLTDGRELVSDPATARGDPDSPLTDWEIQAKFRTLATPILGAPTVARIESAVAALPEGGYEELLDLVLGRPGTSPAAC